VIQDIIQVAALLVAVVLTTQKNARVMDGMMQTGGAAKATVKDVSSKSIEIITARLPAVLIL